MKIKKKKFLSWNSLAPFQANNLNRALITAINETKKRKNQKDNHGIQHSKNTKKSSFLSKREKKRGILGTKTGIFNLDFP